MAVRTDLIPGGIVRGDAFPLRRTITGVPSTLTISKAWLTIKENIADADGSAKVQKTVTTTDNAGVGQIENAGTNGIAVLRFDFVNTDTGALSAGSGYFFDIQIQMSNGERHTVEQGIVQSLAEVTVTLT